MIPDDGGPVLDQAQLNHEAREPGLRATLDLARELEMRRCRRNYLYFLQRWWTIQLHKTASETIWSDMWPCQLEILAAWHTGRQIVGLKARQLGHSTGAGGYNGWDIGFHPNTEILFLSRREDDAYELLDKAKFGWDRLPAWMAERLPRKNSKNRQELSLDNHSRIVSLPSKTNAARSRSARRVVADEFAFFEDPDEAISSMRPVSEGGGQAIYISTANGVGNAFERMCMNAHEGRPVPYTFLFHPWHANPERTQEWRDGLEASGMLPWTIAQEYPGSVEEAFLRSGNTYFDRETLHNLFHSVQVGIPQTGELTYIAR